MGTFFLILFLLIVSAVCCASSTKRFGFLYMRLKYRKALPEDSRVFKDGWAFKKDFARSLLLWALVYSIVALATAIWVVVLLAYNADGSIQLWVAILVVLLCCMISTFFGWIMGASNCEDLMKQACDVYRISCPKFD